MPDYLRSDPPALIHVARQSGNAGELLSLYRSYLKVLARIQIGKHLQGKTDASDVVQEVYLKASRGFAEFRGGTEQELLAWLRKILSRVVADLVRHYVGTQSRDVRLEENMDRQLANSTACMRSIAAGGPTASELAVRKEQAILLTNALEELPEDYREVVLMRHVEQLSFAEVADRMGRSIHSVRNLWPRALAKLRAQLEEQR